MRTRARVRAMTGWGAAIGPVTVLPETPASAGDDEPTSTSRVWLNEGDERWWAEPDTDGFPSATCRAPVVESGQVTPSLGLLGAHAPTRVRYLPPNPERPWRYLGRRGLGDARRTVRNLHVRVAKLERCPQTWGETRDRELAQLPRRLPRRIVRGEVLAGGVEHDAG